MDPEEDDAWVEPVESAPLLPAAGLRIVFVDPKTKEVRTVGRVPDSCPLLIRKKKKGAKVIQIPGASLATVECVAEFVQGNGTLRHSLTLAQVGEVYAAAKEIGSEDLIQACVARVWDMRGEWDEGAGEEDMETEHPWVYTLIG